MGWEIHSQSCRPAVPQTEKAGHRTPSHARPAAAGTTNGMNPESWVPEPLAPHWKGFPGSSDGKESACNSGNLDLEAHGTTWVLFVSISGCSCCLFWKKSVQFQVRTHSSSPFPCVPCCFPWLLPCHPYLERSPPLLFHLLLAITTGSLTSEWVWVTILQSFHSFFPSPWRAILLLLHLCSSDDELPGPEARIGASAPEPHGHGGLWAHTWNNWSKQNES